MNPNLDPVLADLEACKRALQSDDPQARIAAIERLLNWGEAGAERVIHYLHQDPDWQVQYAAWRVLLLAGRDEWVQVATDFPIPYRLVPDLQTRYRQGERDFRWVSLAGMSFSDGLDLSGADLGGANLAKVSKYGGWKLINSNLFRALLWGANLSHSDLAGACLQGVMGFGVNFSSTSFSGTDLTAAYLSEANFTEANASGARLLAADLSHANLGRANFSHADLTRVDLSGANLFQSRFYRATLKRARLVGVNATGANFPEADLRRAQLIGANLANANLAGADLRGANLTGANLTNANLSGAHLQGAVVSLTNFTNAILPNGALCSDKNPIDAFIGNAL